MSLEDELHDHGVVEETDFGDGVGDAIETLEEIEQSERDLPESSVARTGAGTRLFKIPRENLQPAAQPGTELQTPDLEMQGIAQRAEAGDGVHRDKVATAIDVDGSAGDLAGAVGGEVAVEFGRNATGGRGCGVWLHGCEDNLPQKYNLGYYKRLLIF